LTGWLLGWLGWPPEPGRLSCSLPACLAHWLATQMAGLGIWPIEVLPPAECLEKKKKKN